jgi:hypothetical protein
MATFRKVELVASDDDRPGFIRIGALVDGAFVCLADPPAGHVRQTAKSTPSALPEPEAPPPPPSE